MDARCPQCQQLAYLFHGKGQSCFAHSGIAALVPEGRQILLVSFLATTTPTATTITQLAQVCGNDAEYASAINVVTTGLCVLTIPIMVMLYQL